MWKTGAALAVALCTFGPVTASGLDDEAAAVGARRIRAADPRMRALIAAGAERSVTFRDLIGRFSRTHWVVFVQRGRCPDSTPYQGLRAAPIGAPACLIHRVGTFEGEPYLIVRIDTRHSRTPDQEVELIAHELQHALEAAEAPEVIDSHTLIAFFRRISDISFRAPGLVGYETPAAIRVGNRVLSELAAKHPRRDASPQATTAADASHVEK